MLLDSPLEAVVVLAAFILLFHLAFLWKWRLSARGWKKVDYWWLGLAALGLISATGEVRRLQAGGDIIVAEALAHSALQELKTSTAPERHCNTLLRSEYPRNFDSLKAQQQRLCAWATEFAVRLPDSLVAPTCLMDVDSVQPDPSIVDFRLQRDIDEAL